MAIYQRFRAAIRSQSLVVLVAALPVFATSRVARADGLLYQLPKDGSSVTFDLQVIDNQGPLERVMKGSFVMKSVGSKEVDGETCRWIEFNMTVDVPGAPEPRVVIAKTLIPERALKRGENSFAQFKEAWLKQSRSEVEKITEAVGEPAGPLQAFLGGPLDDEKELEAATVVSGLGELECKVLAARLSWTQTTKSDRLSSRHACTKRRRLGSSSRRFGLPRLGTGKILMPSRSY